MGVLPESSCHCLPPAYQPLFSAYDSPILDFYPKDFQVDMNGKRFAWQVRWGTGFSLYLCVQDIHPPAYLPACALLVSTIRHQAGPRNEIPTRLMPPCC